MLSEVHPILPMRDKAETKAFYTEKLTFIDFDKENKYQRYLMIRKDNVEIHFSLYENLLVEKNDSSCYIRTDNVEEWYQLVKEKSLHIEQELKDYPWKQKEFVLRDPNNNFIVFGGSIG